MSVHSGANSSLSVPFANTGTIDRDTLKHVLRRKPNSMLILAAIVFLAIMAMPAFAKQSQIRKMHSQIEVSGVRRRFTVCIPNGCQGRAVPLVIVLHGAFGNAWSAEYDSRMTQKAQKEGFIVCYPDGTGLLGKVFLTWNVGPCCGIAGHRQTNDLDFIRRMITSLESKYLIDANRVYVTGLSNGGMLAFKIGAEMPELVAAIAPISCCMYSVSKAINSPVSVVAFHGTRDRVIPYRGGTGWFYGYRIKTKPILEAIQYWVKRDGCENIPTSNMDTFVQKDIYRGGISHTEVCLYTIKGGGHSWPGGRNAFPLADPPDKSVSATDLMWEFFREHPKWVLSPVCLTQGQSR